MRLVVGPGGVEIGERLGRDHLLLGLAFVEQLLDAVARRSPACCGSPRRRPWWRAAPWPTTILVLSLADLEIGVVRADHAAHVAAIGEVDVLVALEIVQGVAGGEHIGVGEIDPGVAVGMGVGDMRELRLAPADFERESSRR